MTNDTVLTPIDPAAIQFVILPDRSFVNLAESKTYTILNLPHPKTLEEQQFIIYKDSLPNGTIIHELNKISFKNPHLSAKKQPIETLDGKPIRSILFNQTKIIDQGAENSQAGEGYVLEDPRIQIATKFNSVYWLLAFYKNVLIKNEDELRFSSYEDIVEKLDNNDTFHCLIDLDIDFNKSLKVICECIEENEEFFYKVSIKKILKYLKMKIEKIASQFPESIKQSLLDDKFKLPIIDIAEEEKRSIEEKQTAKQEDEKIMNLAKLQYSIHLLGSYLDDYYINKLLSLYDFSPIQERLDKIVSLQQEQNVALANLEALNGNLSSINENNKKRTKDSAKGANKKKPASTTKKVASGKGALDGFFKKKVEVGKGALDGFFKKKS
ncbi:hypothetical protein B5S28_g4223 [[Candida] boidinii]|nr:hypothetical protein B5S28_g4223 [[Candida] boidinii]OWB59357.1 hypothetical protein B5S29_g214 [[Candida] boidinii]OWB72472.1 hypothetical protein B5S31_g2185 [[Candida] boidinii]